VALTFDAGGNAAAVTLILKTLAANHLHATFFLTGKSCVGSALALPRIFAHLNKMHIEVVPVSEILRHLAAPAPQLARH
jgi:peptidoglycan/xylan/chitin deacetylase (PgdA/CDA1 family)